MTKLVLHTHLQSADAGLFSAMHISNTTSVQLQARIAIVADRQAHTRNLGGRLGTQHATLGLEHKRSSHLIQIFATEVRI